MTTRYAAISSGFGLAESAMCNIVCKQVHCVVCYYNLTTKVQETIIMVYGNVCVVM